MNVYRFCAYMSDDTQTRCDLPFSVKMSDKSRQMCDKHHSSEIKAKKEKDSAFSLKMQELLGV